LYTVQSTNLSTILQFCTKNIKKYLKNLDEGLLHACNSSYILNTQDCSLHGLKRVFLGGGVMFFNRRGFCRSNLPHAECGKWHLREMTICLEHPHGKTTSKLKEPIIV
jgi:hypothetical protein